MTAGSGFDPENCRFDLLLDGQTLYVAGLSGLQSYDVADPLNPLLLDQFRHPDGFQDAQGVVVDGETMHVMTGEGRGYELSSVNIGSEPVTVLSARWPFAAEPMLDLLSMGDTLSAPVWMGGIYTLDVSDPAAPRLLYSPQKSDTPMAEQSSLAIHGDVLYVPISDGELLGTIGAIDLSDPSNPTVAGVVATGEIQVIGLAVGEDALYALTQGAETRLYVIDISRPLNPDAISRMTLPAPASRLVVSGDTLLAVCDGWNCTGLYALDVERRDAAHAGSGMDSASPCI